MSTNDNKYIEYFTKYKGDVKEFLYKESKYIFIVESPHKEELKNQYVVAGSSGKSISNVLGFGDEALGTLLDKKEISNISVLNVSRVPLQKIDEFAIEYSDSIEDLNVVRDNPKAVTNRDNENINEFECLVLKDFKERMENIHFNSDGKMIIVCGSFAEYYFKKIIEDMELKCDIKYLPHPSYKKWELIMRYKEEMTNLYAEFNLSN